ncbi:MAG: imidazole glycerol phosphate synthase subunit HisH [Phycisphaerales bacterium]
MSVLVVQTGVANTASVCAALARCGLAPEIASDAERIASSDRVVLPGVGSFGAGMAALRRQGIDEALRERVASGRKTLAVCLGLQLLAAESEESPGVEGLGLLDARVTRFPEGTTCPQFGWNRVAPPAGSGVIEPGYAYFANSYRLRSAPNGWDAAMSEHGGPFVAAMWRSGVLACQFHPELSGAWGLGVIKRWGESKKEAAAC